jgi:CO/xanthine dehydrogenase Mo-binding subunit
VAKTEINGAKGLGELTAVSVAPAIADAVYHATGKYIRDLPTTARSFCEIHYAATLL